jgi:uncharacterized protein YjaG (DUF416 family)
MSVLYRKIKIIIKNNNFHKNVLSAALNCEKLLPIYDVFHRKCQWGDTACLKEQIILLYDIALQRTPIFGIEDIKEKLQLIAPDLDDFNTPLASYALDVCCSFDEVLEYLVSHNNKNIENSITHIIDTIDLYIQLKNNIEYGDPHLEYKIDSDIIMQQEYERQLSILQKIKTNNITEDFILEIRTYNNDLKNIIM